MHKNIHTNETLNRLPVPLIRDGKPNFNPTPQQYHEAGWRSVVAMPTPEGYVRTGWQEEVWNEARDRYERHPITITQAEYDEQQQAAIDAADPMLYPSGIEAPRIVLQTETEKKGVAYFADDDGTLLSYVEHASPRIPPEARRAAIADALENHAIRKLRRGEAVKGVGRGNLQDRIEALENWVRAQ